MMKDRSRERAREDYVKAIYQLSERGAVRGADLARHFTISRSSVSQFRRILENDELLEPVLNRRASFVLTERGVDLAVRMVRRHRVVETFLHSALGIAIDAVHCEAERIEHVVTDDVVARIARLLGNPQTDPHGHAIPYAGTAVQVLQGVELLTLAGGCRFTVLSVDDHHAENLRTLAAMHVLPGFRAEVLANESEGIRLQPQSAAAPFTIGRNVAAGVVCTIDQAAA